MFTKFIKNLFKETTNVATTGSVTLNTSGTYNPKYGKQHIIIEGKGGTGTYTAGGDYYNYVAGTPKYTFVQGTPNYTGDVAHPSTNNITRSNTDYTFNYAYVGNTASASSTETINVTDDHPGTAYSSGYKNEYGNVEEYGVIKVFDGAAGTLNAVINSTPVWYYSVSGNYTITYASNPGTDYPDAAYYIDVYAFSGAYVSSHNYSAVYNVVAAPASYNANTASTFSYIGEFDATYYAVPSPTFPHIGYANPVATNGTVPAYYNTPILPTWHVTFRSYSRYHTYNYAWTERGPVSGDNSYYNYDGKNADQFPYAGTNNPTVNTGGSINVFGVSMPGGYGGAATAISPTTASYLSVNKLTSVSITVPSGGYVKITYKI